MSPSIDDWDELGALVDRFIGGDRSIETANELEALLQSRFAKLDFQEDLVEDLARYRPGGGDYLMDEARMLDKLALLRTKLDLMTVDSSQ